MNDQELLDKCCELYHAKGQGVEAVNRFCDEKKTAVAFCETCDDVIPWIKERCVVCWAASQTPKDKVLKAYVLFDGYRQTEEHMTASEVFAFLSSKKVEDALNNESIDSISINLWRVNG